MMSLTEYERNREARIARNRAILAQLVGHLPAHLALKAGHGGSSAGGGQVTKRARAGKNEGVAAAAEFPPAELRRSGRIRNMPAPIYTSFEVRGRQLTFEKATNRRKSKWAPNN